MINHFLTEQADRLDVLEVPDKKSRLLPVGGKRFCYERRCKSFAAPFFMCEEASPMYRAVKHGASYQPPEAPPPPKLPPRPE